MVGFEGAGQYAETLGLEIPPGGGRHASIKNHSTELLKKLVQRLALMLGLASRIRTVKSGSKLNCQPQN